MQRWQRGANRCVAALRQLGYGDNSWTVCGPEQAEAMQVEHAHGQTTNLWADHHGKKTVLE